MVPCGDRSAADSECQWQRSQTFQIVRSLAPRCSAHFCWNRGTVVDIFASTRRLPSPWNIFAWFRFELSKVFRKWWQSSSEGQRNGRSRTWGCIPLCAEGKAGFHADRSLSLRPSGQLDCPFPQNFEGSISRRFQCNWLVLFGTQSCLFIWRGSKRVSLKLLLEFPLHWELKEI